MKTEHWVIVILVFLVGALTRLPLPQQPVNNQQNAQGVGAGQQRVGQPILPANPNQNANSAQQEREDSNGFWSINISDVLTGIFTFFLVLITWRQALLMTTQTKLMNQQNMFAGRQTTALDNQTLAMDRQTEHMETGLQLTRDSNEAAREALLTLESPFVFCSRIQISHLAAEERPMIIVHFKNGGRAISRGIVLSAVFEFILGDDPGHLLGVVRDGVLQQGPFSLAAGESTFLAIAYPNEDGVPSDVMRKLATGEITLWVAGKIVFENPLKAKRIENVYCARYIVFGPDWKYDRPKFPSDFWIHNNMPTLTREHDIADQQKR